MKLYNTRMGLIDIKNISGDIRFSTDFNVGSIGRYSLGKEDYITLPFNVLTPINFKVGDYVDLSGILDESLGGKFAKIYEVVDLPTPTYDQSTGGYNYELRLDAYYWKWKNKKFKYTPEVAGQEASWNLTASLDMQLGVFLRNLQALGYKYRGNDFDFSIDSSVENSAKLMSYENTNLLDALTNMAETWNCEWWVEDNIIRFGRCENGDAVRIELGVEAQEMPRSESQGTYATRVYAFGSTRNIPSNYRPVDETVVVNGVVQRRLMLPEGTPYIDAYRYKDGKRVYIGEEGYDIGTEMPQEEAIEDIIFLDEVYPRTECVVGTVGSYTSTVEDEETQETVTQTFYYVTDTSGLVFDESYIIDGEELRLVFQSGLLNGMDFGVTFHKAGTSLGSVTLESDVYEIVANDDYGRTLPDETLKPTTRDKFILYGWDSTKITDLGLVSNAEQELRDKTVDRVKKMMVDDGTYNTTLASSWVKENMISRTFDIGQRIELVNKSFFETSRISRVIGLEIKLDLPYDAPVYTIGESTAYSRIGELENKVDNITYKGQTYTNGGGKGVYVIRTNDSTAPSNSNVFSALRSLAMFLRKDKEDTANGLITFLKGAVFGKNGFASGLTGFGAKIFDTGHGEFESMFIRRFLEVPELRYNRVMVTLGDKWRAPGAGIIETVDTGTKTCTLKLEDGEIGAVAVGDICMGIYHNITGNATEDYDDGKGNRRFAGFCTVYFTITEVTGERNETFKYQLRPTSSSWSSSFDPFEMMNFVAYGNFTDTDRQTSVYETRTYTRMLWKQNTWEISAANVALQYGDLSNLNIFGLNMDGYSMYLNNIYMTGIIKQIKPDGTPVQTLNFREEGYIPGVHYDYYDSLSYNGSMWACINEDGSSAAPGSNGDWLEIASKGDQGNKGDKGDGYTQMGQFKTGMVVPKMGVVSMGGGSYVAKASTTNPPLWCWTDNAGNRFTFADGGYVLTGEVNTAEYDVWAEKGEPGKDGTDGKDGEDGKDGKPGEQGIQGIQGCIIRSSEWASGVTYRNDEDLTSGTRYIDIVMVRNNRAVDGWDVYKCIKTHTSSSSITYANTTYWTELSNVGPIYTSLIISKDASLDFVQGNELLIKDSNNNIVAGLTGGSSKKAGTTPVRIWAGGGVPGSAPFRVDQEGNLVATKANITGTITATGGVIGGFNIGSNYIGSTNMSAVNVDNLLLQYDKFEMKYDRFQSIDGHLYQGTLDTVIRSGSITVSSTGDVSTANDTLHVRCGNYIFSVGRNGIRKSTNGGSTWVDL